MNTYIITYRAVLDFPVRQFDCKVHAPDEAAAIREFTSGAADGSEIIHIRVVRIRQCAFRPHHCKPIITKTKH